MHIRLHEHDCDASATEHLASPENQYHYVGSGLTNVYLVGIKFWTCAECNQQSAEIPALNHLLAAIARTIVEKHSPLTGAQVRFLRKRLSKKSMDFATMIGVTAQRYSAIESNENSTLSEGRDKLVRFIYRDFSGDKQLRNALASEEQIEKWLTSIHGRGSSERIVATWLGNHKWRVEAEPMAA
jgi:DNA-binding transcriptional regulator YiaG